MQPARRSLSRHWLNTGCCKSTANRESGRMAEKRRFPTIMVLAGLGVVGVIAFAIWLGLKGSVPSLKLTEAEAKDLIHVKNVALGELENQHNKEAIYAFCPLL